MTTPLRLLILELVLAISSMHAEPANAMPTYCDVPDRCTSFPPDTNCTCPPGTSAFPLVVTCAGYYAGACEPQDSASMSEAGGAGAI